MNLMILGGWGMPASVLVPLGEALAGLPYIGQVQCRAIDQPLDPWREQVLASLAPRTILLGWSLGGMLVWELAARAPDRVRGVVTLASNPRFLADADWPWGYDPEKFEAFRQDLARDPEALLSRFAALISLGSPRQREELRWLRACLAEAGSFAPPVLAESLEALARLDLRDRLPALAMPVLHLLGARDALVPAELASHLKTAVPHHRVELLSEMAHVPGPGCRQVLAGHLGDFFERLMAADRQPTGARP